MEGTPPDRLMTTAEVAEYLRSSEAWISGLVHSGRLPVITLGPEDRPKSKRGPRMWRFRREDVEHFVSEARVTMRDASHAGEGEVSSPSLVQSKPLRAPIPGWDGIPRLRRNRSAQLKKP